jgi:transposase
LIFLRNYNPSQYHFPVLEWVMHYSIDLRQKVMSGLKRGMSKAALAQAFGIDRKTIYNWQQRADLAPRLAKTRLRKLDSAKLQALVKATPDARLVDFATQLNVSINAIHYQFKRLGIRKKNDPIRGTQVYTKD